MAVIRVNINPEVLRWARQEAGYSVNEVAEKLKSDRYAQWEDTGKDVPFGQLRKVANHFKRQVTVFFLPETPPSITKPKDYRNLAPSASHLSKEVLLVLRRAHRLQRLAGELKDASFWKKQYTWVNKVPNAGKKRGNQNNNMAAWLREILQVSVDDQLQWKIDSKAYKNWRLAVEEKLGILVFQFPMPMEEVQGFCLTDTLPYVIVTNSRHTYYGRIFTIFHELAHIMRNESGMCLMDLANTTDKQQEEFACNSFAGKFLIPENSIVPADNLKEITTYANKLGVSREVYLRRLKEAGVIPDRQFFTLLEQIKATYKTRSSGGFVPPDVKSKASRGETFYNMVFDAVNQNRISYTDAAHALDLRINKLVNEL